jgi:hypothetical protein
LQPNGRCFCEDMPSTTAECGPNVGVYDRYDIVPKYSPKLRIIKGTAKSLSAKIFDGDCEKGVAFLMFDAGDNPGGVDACFAACLSKKQPLQIYPSNSVLTWETFVAKGIVVRSTDNKCYCENVASEEQSCGRTLNTWVGTTFVLFSSVLCLSSTFLLITLLF